MVFALSKDFLECLHTGVINGVHAFRGEDYKLEFISFFPNVIEQNFPEIISISKKQS